MGVILELLIRSVVLKFEGSSKNIANKNIKPLDNPNKIQKPYQNQMRQTIYDFAYELY
jgi:hypothetical protein